MIRLRRVIVETDSHRPCFEKFRFHTRTSVKKRANCPGKWRKYIKLHDKPNWSEFCATKTVRYAKQTERKASKN